MLQLRMASTRPSWMTQPRPKLASAPPKSPQPKRMRCSKAAPEIELTPPPESPTTAMTQAVPPAAEATTQVVPQAGEPKTLASLAGVAESNKDSDEGMPDGAEKDETGPDQC